MVSGRKMAFVAIVVIIVAASLGFYFLQYGGIWGGRVTKITWQRTGGFMGINEALMIESDGSASLTSNLLGDMELVLSEVEFKSLISLIKEANFFRFDDSYRAKSGVADYFIYRLTVETTSMVKTVEWVDSWASEKTLPEMLGEIEGHILSIIQGEGFGSIEGTVFDQNEKPISDMRVSIVNGTTSFPEILAITNEEGYYLIGSVPPGVFMVGVHDLQGERIGLKSVYVRGGETSTLNFNIQSSAPA